jgi:hypothetical protein
MYNRTLIFAQQTCFVFAVHWIPRLCAHTVAWSAQGVGWGVGVRRRGPGGGGKERFTINPQKKPQGAAGGAQEGEGGVVLHSSRV